MKNEGFKIGVCDWSIGCPSRSDSFALAKQIGADGVQVAIGIVDGKMPLTDTKVQDTFKKGSSENNVCIASVALPELNKVPYKSDPRAERWVADSINVCKALDAKVILLPFFGKGDLRGDHKGIDEVVRRLKKIAPQAESSGIILGIESYLSAWETMDIIDCVGLSCVQMYYDVGNSHSQGYDICEEIRWLGRKHICEFHAKDYDNIFGTGKIHFPAVRLAMDDIGYKGWIHIEGAAPFGILQSYTKDVKYLRSVFPL